MPRFDKNYLKIKLNMARHAAKLQRDTLNTTAYFVVYFHWSTKFLLNFEL